MMPLVASTPPSHYRSDIDGLRAVAVTAVVLFHAGVPGFGGGYLGVDVFFVISGFLITGILQTREPSVASLLWFYERRIRRIVPALVLVLAASSLAAFVILSPYDLRGFSRSVISATGFAANFDNMKQGNNSATEPLTIPCNIFGH
jgi:peptidoglycan/LPS O-acetylase OafA/YrhL